MFLPALSLYTTFSATVDRNHDALDNRKVSRMGRLRSLPRKEARAAGLRNRTAETGTSRSRWDFLSWASDQMLITGGLR